MIKPIEGTPRVLGELTYVNYQGGYGMVLAVFNGARTEFFVHASECRGIQFDELKTGDGVSFVPGMSAKGPRAFEVEREEDGRGRGE